MLVIADPVCCADDDTEDSAGLRPWTEEVVEVMEDCAAFMLLLMLEAAEPVCVKPWVACCAAGARVLREFPVWSIDVLAPLDALAKLVKEEPRADICDICDWIDVPVFFNAADKALSCCVI